MNEKIALLTAMRVDHLPVTELKSALHTAGISVDESYTLSYYPGCILFVDKDQHLPWLEEKLHINAVGGIQSIVIWGKAAPLGHEVVWQLLSLGASDVIHWINRVTTSAQVISRIKRWLHIEKCMCMPIIKEQLAGSSPTWTHTLRQLVEVAVFSQAPVLILGGSGTGKEMAARLIHQFDIRSYKQELVLLDCSSVASELSGSEFFGHEKGAFTNAMNTRQGAFELGDKGTLFLDEIGELPLSLQAELLRVIQEGTYKRLGSNAWKRTEFRLVSATNRVLEKQVEEKGFRADLYYRISTWVCRMPALSERTEDIPELVYTFLKQLIPDHNKRPVVDPLLMSYLCNRRYPGNVRELKQVVTRLVSRYTGVGVLTLGDIPACDRTGLQATSEPIIKPELSGYVKNAIASGSGLKSIIQHVSELAKKIAIEQVNGNLQAASALLKVTDRTLQLYCSERSRSTSSEE